MTTQKRDWPCCNRASHAELLAPTVYPDRERKSIGRCEIYEVGHQVYSLRRVGLSGLRWLYTLRDATGQTICQGRRRACWDAIQRIRLMANLGRRP